MEEVIREFLKEGILGAMLIALGLYHVLREKRWDKIIDRVFDLAEKSGVIREAVDDLKEQTDELKRERQFQQKVLHQFYQNQCQPEHENEKKPDEEKHFFGLL